MSELIELLGMTEEELIGSDFFQAIPGVPIREELDNELYYDFAENGIEFLLTDEPQRVASIFLHSGSYEGELPYSLAFSMSSDRVHVALGKPSTSIGGKGKKTLLGPTPPTDRYDWEDISLSVQYANDRNSIDMLCLMVPSAVPR